MLALRSKPSTDLRPPSKRFGGKWALRRRIVARMEGHRTYLEPFLGGGSVLLCKRPAAVEVAADVDPGLIGMWSAIRDRGGELAEILAEIPYTEDSFRASIESPGEPGTVEEAASYLIRHRFSRVGLGKDFAWSDRLRGGKPEGENAWDTFRAQLPALSRRVRNVDFRCVDAFGLIAEFGDDPDALLFCDPPYPLETRTAVDTYAFEVTARSPRRTSAARAARIEADRAWHRRLLAALSKCRAAVLLSGYRSAIYDAALAGWRLEEFSIANHAGQGKTKGRRVECLWSKPGDGGFRLAAD